MVGLPLNDSARYIPNPLYPNDEEGRAKYLSDELNKIAVFCEETAKNIDNVIVIVGEGVPHKLYGPVHIDVDYSKALYGKEVLQYNATTNKWEAVIFQGDDCYCFVLCEEAYSCSSLADWFIEYVDAYIFAQTTDEFATSTGVNIGYYENLKSAGGAYAENPGYEGNNGSVTDYYISDPGYPGAAVQNDFAPCTPLDGWYANSTSGTDDYVDHSTIQYHPDYDGSQYIGVGDAARVGFIYYPRSSYGNNNGGIFSFQGPTADAGKSSWEIIYDSHTGYLAYSQWDSAFAWYFTAGMTKTELIVDNVDPELRQVAVLVCEVTRSAASVVMDVYLNGSFLASTSVDQDGLGVNLDVSSYYLKDVSGSTATTRFPRWMSGKWTGANNGALAYMFLQDLTMDFDHEEFYRKWQQNGTLFATGPKVPRIGQVLKYQGLRGDDKPIWCPDWIFPLGEENYQLEALSNNQDDVIWKPRGVKAFFQRSEPTEAIDGDLWGLDL